MHLVSYCVSVPCPHHALVSPACGEGLSWACSVSGRRGFWPAIRWPGFDVARACLLRRTLRGDIPCPASQSLHPHSPVIPPTCGTCRFWSLSWVTILVSWRFPRCETLGFTPFCGVQGSGMGAALPITMRTTEDRLTALIAIALMLSGCSMAFYVARMLEVL